MILHALIVDDQQHELDSLVPSFPTMLGQKLKANTAFQKANQAAGYPLPHGENATIGVRVSTHGYTGRGSENAFSRTPFHVRLHLCKETDFKFRTPHDLLRDHFVAVVLSDLKFSTEQREQGGRSFLAFLQQRFPEVYGILYSSFSIEINELVGFPEERFVRKTNLQFYEKLCDKMVEGFTAFLSRERIRRFALALKGSQDKGNQVAMPFLYRSDSFGTVLRQLYNIAAQHFGQPADTLSGQPLPTLLIDGESGNGKSQLARLLHQVSERANEPYYAVTPDKYNDRTFLNTEMFGYEKGAFTGADERHAGLAERTGHGILLLDDLHKITEATSETFHYFLDTRLYTPMRGEPKESRAGVICTVETTRWAQIIQEKLLPQSFIDRVRQMPPLFIRSLSSPERRDDLICLVHHYCEVHAEKWGHPIQLKDAALDWLSDFKPVGSGVRTLQSFLKGLLDENCNIWELDAGDLEDYSRRKNLLPKPAAVPKNSRPARPRPPLDEKWGDVPDLAVQMLTRELSLEGSRASQLQEDLFEEFYPAVWDRYCALKQSHAEFDLQLFTKLLRFYAIVAEGNVARAAKQLGIERQALQPHVYAERDQE